MYEQHQLEQYFFDNETIDTLATWIAGFENPCCLCTPMVGRRLEALGVNVTTLDSDDRFATLKGYQPYNIFRPHYLQQRFGIILCDPPFFRVSLSQLFTAIRMLAHYEYSQRLAICYLERREINLCGTFHSFNLVNTGYYPKYLTVQDTPKNTIALYSNVSFLPSSTVPPAVNAV